MNHDVTAVLILIALWVGLAIIAGSLPRRPKGP